MTGNMALVGAAARENAEWCEAVARSHGIRSEFLTDAWVAHSRTPERYPDAVTLRPDATDSLLQHIDLTPGCAVKDSFGSLDLSHVGFTVTTDARWIYRAPDPFSDSPPAGSGDGTGASADDGLVWSALEPDDLLAWSTLHDHEEGAFRRSLMAEPGVVLLRLDQDSELVGGAVLSHTGAVVGISNVVAGAGIAADALWRGLTDAATTRFPGLAMVGYEAGADLIAPLDAGFQEFGDLRIWMR